MRFWWFIAFLFKTELSKLFDFNVLTILIFHFMFFIFIIILDVQHFFAAEVEYK